MMKAILNAGLVAGLAAGMLAAQNTPVMGTAGTVNYIDGQVSVNGSDLANRRTPGPAVLEVGGVLTTQNGRAEILLAPGEFLRVGRNSEVRMVSSDMVDPKVELTRGEAMIEVDQKLNNERIDVVTRGVDATILKNGLYRFDGDNGRIGVLDGKLSVPENGKTKEIGKGHEFMLNGGPVPTVASFDPKAEDDLYVWSRMRSGYMAEVNSSEASSVYRGSAPFAGTGWYWNPYFTSWAWLPGDGYFYGPFGYPFFSPAFAFYAPYYRGGYGFRGGVVARGGFARGASGVAAFRGGAAFHGGGGRR